MPAEVSAKNIKDKKYGIFAKPPTQNHNSISNNHKND
jgi:hypothetical protein